MVPCFFMYSWLLVSLRIPERVEEPIFVRGFVFPVERFELAGVVAPARLAAAVRARFRVTVVFYYEASHG